MPDRPLWYAMVAFNLSHGNYTASVICNGASAQVYAAERAAQTSTGWIASEPGAVSSTDTVVYVPEH